MEQEVRVTNDGSKTIYLPHLDETYHSSHGAIQEALHVFVKNGIQAIEKSEIKVFEMGFGTGLNALLTLVESQNKNIKISYTGIEAYPVSVEFVEQMDYCKQIGAEFQPQFDLLHSLEWGKLHTLSDLFFFEKIDEKIENFSPRTGEYDIIFYDAFGPRAQEEMWAPEILKKMYDMVNEGGFLVTYCAKGQVKRDLKLIGFEIEALPGPPGKREMTRAWKRPSH